MEEGNDDDVDEVNDDDNDDDVDVDEVNDDNDNDVVGNDDDDEVNEPPPLKIVTKGEIEALHEKVNKDTGSDFRPLWKLRSNHFQCANSERQG